MTPYTNAHVQIALAKLEALIGIPLEYRKGDRYVCHRVSNSGGDIRIEFEANTKRELINAIMTWRNGYYVAQDIAAAKVRNTGK